MHACPEPDAWFALGDDPLLVQHLDRCADCRRVAAMIGRLGVLGEAPAASRDDVGVVPELVPAGTTLGRFVVRGAIGAGGMGVVLEAFDPKLERTVALKVVRKLRDDTNWDLARDRVLAEAKAMARLSHPNVVAIHDLFEIDNERLIAMEHVAGPDLETWLAGKPAFAARVDVVLGLAQGLAAAHAAGIVHRDIKPTNVLVANGQARVTDFGLASLGGVGTRAIGTSGYAAPEVIAGGVADARSDQYSFAVTAWRTLFDAWPPDSGSGPIAKVLTRALAEDPAARWPAMSDVVLALRAKRRWPWVAAALGVAAIAVIAFLALREPPATCELDTSITDVWSADKRAALTKSLGDGIVKSIDSAWSTWQATARAACAKPTPGTLACLASLRRRLVAVLDYAPANKNASKVEDTLAVLRNTDCLAAPPPQPSKLSPATQKLHDQIAAELDEVSTISSLAQYKTALAKLDALLARVPADDVALRGEVQYRRADILGRTGDTAASIPVLQEALAIAEKQGNPIARVNTMILLLSVYDELGRADEANALATVAEAAALAVPYDAGRAARLANVLAGIAYSSGRMADAEKQYREVVAIEEKRYGGKPKASLAGAYYNLALAVLAQGRTADAKALQERSLAMFEATVGPKHPDAALPIGSLAGFAHEAGNYDEAATLYRRQIEIWETSLGKDHPNLSEPLSGLARVEGKRGNNTEAIALYRRAIAVAQKLGADHPLVAQTEDRLAGALVKAKQFKEAEALVEQAVAHWDSNGMDVPDAHLARFELAKYRWDAGKHAQARALAAAARVAVAKLDDRYADYLAEIDAWLASHRSRVSGK
jgi:serine/threonine-protein kinase